MSYITLTLKVDEDDLKEYLSEFMDKEQLENIDTESEAIEAINGILSDHLSDFAVIGKNTLLCGDWD